MNLSAKQGALSAVTALLFLLLGLPLAVGGVRLLALGGSPWFLVIGLLLAAVAWLAWQELLWAASVYAALLLLLGVWSALDVGLIGWWWWPRVVLWWLLAFWWVMPWMWRRLRQPAAGAPAWLRWSVPVALLVVGVLGAVAGTREPTELLGKLANARRDALAAPGYAGVPAGDWAAFGRSNFGDRYAPAAQITPANVARLHEAWSYRMDASTAVDAVGNAVAETPLAVNGMLYICGEGGAVTALDSDSGAERWLHKVGAPAATQPCRGVAYYDSSAYAQRANAAAAPDTVKRPTPKGAVAAEFIQFDSCPRRLFVPGAQGSVTALNADNGNACSDFGDNGTLHLSTPDAAGKALPLSPPAVTRDVLVVSAGSVFGHDIHSGKSLWQWPASGDLRAWGVASVDESLGLVYVEARAGSAGNGSRDQIVALDLATGVQRWAHIEDNAQDGLRGQPVLFELKQGDAPVPALLATTRLGHLVLLDRRDGHRLAQAGQSTEASKLSFAPTQPLLQDRDMWGLTLYDQMICRIRLRLLERSSTESLVFPGPEGVFDTGGVAVDPARAVLVADPGYIAFVARHDGGTASAKPLTSIWGLPCQAPPWGYVAAVDLATLEKLWVRRNGVAADQLPWHLDLPLGVPSVGGMATTGGGVAFLGGTLDKYVRAFDIGTGDPLWRTALPGTLQATPISFISERSGRQYLVVIASGDQTAEGPHGDVVVAYALPLPGK